MADFSFPDMPTIDPISDPSYGTLDPSFFMPTLSGIDPSVNTIDPNQMNTSGVNDLISSLSSSGSGSSAGLSALLKALGLTGSNGQMNSGGLLQLLGLLGGTAGGVMGYNATNKATDQMSQAVKDANSTITGILGGAQAGYSPYSALGSSAAGKLQGMNYQPLAGKFGPVQAASSYVPTSAGTGNTLSQLMRGK